MNLLTQNDKDFFEIKLKDIITDFANKMMELQEMNNKIHISQSQVNDNLLARCKELEIRIKKLEENAIWIDQ